MAELLEELGGVAQGDGAAADEVVWRGRDDTDFGEELDGEELPKWMTEQSLGGGQERKEAPDPGEKFKGPLSLRERPSMRPAVNEAFI